MDLLAKNKCRLADLHLFSASRWEWYFQKLFNESLWLFPPLTFSSSSLSIIGRLSCFIEQTFFFFLTCRRTCFHWITQCSSLRWVFISSLHIESCTAEATNPPNLLNHRAACGLSKASLWICKYTSLSFSLFLPAADLVKCTFNVMPWMS